MALLHHKVVKKSDFEGAQMKDFMAGIWTTDPERPKPPPRGPRLTASRFGSLEEIGHKEERA